MIMSQILNVIMVKKISSYKDYFNYFRTCIFIQVVFNFKQIIMIRSECKEVISERCCQTVIYIYNFLTED